LLLSIKKNKVGIETMKAYSPETNKGRTVAINDIHHSTADQGRKEAKAAAKAMRSQARQDGKKVCSLGIAE
jgi:hypothetical protein